MSKKIAVTVLMDSDSEVTIKPLAAHLATHAANPPDNAEISSSTTRWGTNTVTQRDPGQSDGDGDVEFD